MGRLASAYILIIAILLCGLILLMFAGCSYASDINVERLATAIYRAENSKKYPYGIMVKYKRTTPKQACINTIRHALKDWKGDVDFIDFLGNRYCKVGSNTDNGTCQYWSTNVRSIYEKM